MTEKTKNQSSEQLFYYVCATGDLAHVRALFGSLDKNADLGCALMFAAMRGHLDIVRFLIPHTNPKERESEALRFASHGGHQEVVAFIWDVSDPKKALAKMKKIGHDPKDYRLIEDRLIIEKNREKLIKAALDVNKTNSRKKVKIM